MKKILAFISILIISVGVFFPSHTIFAINFSNDIQAALENPNDSALVSKGKISALKQILDYTKQLNVTQKGKNGIELVNTLIDYAKNDKEFLKDLITKLSNLDETKLDKTMANVFVLLNLKVGYVLMTLEESSELDNLFFEILYGEEINYEELSEDIEEGIKQEENNMPEIKIDEVQTIACESTTLNNYLLASTAGGIRINPTKTENITGGKQTKTQVFTCNNGVFVTGVEKVVSTTCNSGYTEVGEICVSNDIPTNCDNISWQTKGVNKYLLSEASVACSGIGKGWRLPNVNEFKTLYQTDCRDTLGLYPGGTYWSGAENYTTIEADGSVGVATSGEKNLVVCLYDEAYKQYLEALEAEAAAKAAAEAAAAAEANKVYDGTDCDNKYWQQVGELTWSEASSKCSSLGSGRRLPSKDEMASLANASCKNNTGLVRPAVGYTSSSLFTWTTWQNENNSSEMWLIGLHEAGGWQGITRSKNSKANTVCLHDKTTQSNTNPSNNQGTNNSGTSSNLEGVDCAGLHWNDLGKTYIWNDANSKCSALGSGRRLPTRSEVENLSKNTCKANTGLVKEPTGVSSVYRFWTSTASEDHAGQMRNMGLHSSGGYQGSTGQKNFLENTVCVHVSSNTSSSQDSGNSENSNSSISQGVRCDGLYWQNFLEDNSRNNAISKCSSLGSGRRLPTMDEMKSLADVSCKYDTNLVRASSGYSSSSLFTWTSTPGTGEYSSQMAQIGLHEAGGWQGGTREKNYKYNTTCVREDSNPSSSSTNQNLEGVNCNGGYWQQLGRLNRNNANSKCSSLGGNWRLPTKEELQNLGGSSCRSLTGLAQEATGTSSSLFTWTSTPSDNDQMWRVGILVSGGYQGLTGSKTALANTVCYHPYSSYAPGGCSTGYYKSGNSCVSCSYDESALLNAKVKQLIDSKYDGRTNWTVGELELGIKESGFSTPYAWWSKYGKEEGICPWGVTECCTNAGYKYHPGTVVNTSNSNSSSISCGAGTYKSGNSCATCSLSETAILNAKLKQINANKEGGRSNWTMTELKAAISASGLTPTTWWKNFGDEEGVCPWGVTECCTNSGYKYHPGTVVNTSNSNSSNTNSSNTSSSNTQKLSGVDCGGLYWNDLGKTNTWNNANSACSALGSGRRLPTRSDVEILSNSTCKNTTGLVKAPTGASSVYNFWTSTQGTGDFSSQIWMMGLHTAGGWQGSTGQKNYLVNTVCVHIGSSSSSTSSSNSNTSSNTTPSQPVTCGVGTYKSGNSCLQCTYDESAILSSKTKQLNDTRYNGRNNRTINEIRPVILTAYPSGIRAWWDANGKTESVCPWGRTDCCTAAGYKYHPGTVINTSSSTSSSNSNTSSNTTPTPPVTCGTGYYKSGNSCAVCTYNEGATLSAKLKQVNANKEGGRSNWTMSELRTAINGAGFTTIYAWWAAYGKGEGVCNYGVTECCTKAGYKYY